MKSVTSSRTILAILTGFLVLLSLANCTPMSITTRTPTPVATPLVNIQVHNEKLARANSVLTTAGKFAENSFYSCLLNGYMQGLPMAQVSDQCATKLLEDNKQGFGGSFGDQGNIGHEEMFDPNNITAVCNSGDPGRGQSTPPYEKKDSYGYYSWFPESNVYYGLSKEESKNLKEKAIQISKDEDKKFNELETAADNANYELNNAKKSGDPDAIKRAQSKYDEAYKKSVDQGWKALGAREDAKKDPNEKPLPQVHVAPNSPCEKALDNARAILRECNRTGWKDYSCQQLQAKMKGCPDPALIYVNPEQGYSCGESLDAAGKEALKEAWVAKCEELKHFDPNGPNPCSPPTIDESSLTGRGAIGNVCNDPYAFVNPDSNECFATFDLNHAGYGELNVQQIAVWGLNKLGGLIIIIPSPNPTPPEPGPLPRPGPS
jgi:hypothetical protein